MDFDWTYQAPMPNVSEVARRAFIATRANFRRQHLAVQFLKDDGSRDEWSFLNVAQRDAFIAKLTTPYAIS